MRNLHKETGADRFPDIHIVFLASKLGGDERKVEALHDPHELRTDIVCLLKSSVVDKVLIAPIRIFTCLLIRVEDIEKGQLVAINVREARLGLVGSGSGLLRPEEREIKSSPNSE